MPVVKELERRLHIMESYNGDNPFGELTHLDWILISIFFLLIPLGAVLLGA